jgi:hypothetical protein
VTLLATLKLRRTQFWLLLLAGLAVGLAFLPLFNVLGFEFSLAMAVAGSVGAAHLGSVVVGLTRERDEGFAHALRPPQSALMMLVGRGVANGLLLLALPLLIISLNLLRVRNCNYGRGLLFFLMMPCLSVAIAAAVGVLWAMVAPRRWLASVLAILTLLCSMGWGVYRFYVEPPIFGYDAFVGYFPGVLYDEDVAIRPPFFAYRLYNLVWLCALLALACQHFDPATLRLSWRVHLRSIRLRVLALVLVLAGGGLHAFRNQLGFVHTARSIRTALGGVRRTAHFDIYYPAETDVLAVELLAQDHEFRYAQLAATLGVSPGRIESFFFRSPEEKRALMGASHTFIAKPWLRQIYLQLERFPQRALKHELAHVFAGEFGDRLFGVSLGWRWSPLPFPIFSVGLVEGVAVAADWRASNEVTTHEIAAALRRTGMAPPIRPLFGTGFLAQAAGQAYNLAGSFCRYLLDRYGSDRLRQVYRSGGDFFAAYGRDLDSLLMEWKRFLDALPVPEEQLQAAKENFRRPSLLKRTCPHEVANLEADVSTLVGDGRFADAATLVERVIAYQPEEPRHLLELIETRSAAPDGLAPARELVPRLLAHPSLTLALRRRAYEAEGDLAWRAEDLTTAARAYRDAEGGSPTERRALEVKRWALTQGATVRNLAREYLLPPAGKRPSDTEAARAVHLAHRLAEELPTSGIGPYLIGKQLWARAAYAQAVDPLRRALERPLPGREFRREATFGLAQCLYASRAAERSVQPLLSLLEDKGLPPGVRIEARDWLERARWYTSGLATAATGREKRQELPTKLR